MSTWIHNIVAVMSDHSLVRKVFHFKLEHPMTPTLNSWNGETNSNLTWLKVPWKEPNRINLRSSHKRFLEIQSNDELLKQQWQNNERKQHFSGELGNKIDIRDCWWYLINYRVVNNRTCHPKLFQSWILQNADWGVHTF